MNGFQSITSWDQVSPFSGRMIAYQTNSVCFSAMYAVESIYFGYISTKDPIDLVAFKANLYGKGHVMVKLSTSKEMVISSILTDALLQQGQISMRLATKEEIESIREKIKDGHLRLGEIDPQKSDEIFTAALCLR